MDELSIEILADRNAHISTEIIKKDISDTKWELQPMEDELDILMKNPPANKTRIYFLEGGIEQRRKFIKNLEAILKYRTRRWDDKAIDEGKIRN